MGNEPSKKVSSKKSGDVASKSSGGSKMGPLEVLSSSLCDLCSPILHDSSQQAPNVDSTAASTTPTDDIPIVTAPDQTSSSSGKHKTGRSNHHQPASSSRKKTHNTTVDKSDRSIKTSIRNVKLDVAGVDKKITPADESAHTFAASRASSSHYRKGNDYVMITDAMSDVRIK